MVSPADNNCLYERTKYHPEKTCKIFSADGGGVRGIIPAIIEKEIEKRTNKKAVELFDVFGGASTGAILATGLDMGFSAEKIVELFENESKEIFKPPSLWNKISTFGYMTSAKYGKGENLTKVLEKFAGGYLFKDLIKDMIIPAFEITENKPWYFRRDIAKENPDYSNLTVVEVDRATSAAPTYYDPVPVTLADHTYAFIDGGVFENNPASAICRITRENLGHSKDLFVLSLGTGIYKKQIPYSDSKHWGTYFWGFDILDIIFDASSEAIDTEMAASFNHQYQDHAHNNFYRFQTEVDKKNSKLDDASKKNIGYLIDKADEEIENEDEKLRDLCQFLEKEADIEEV